MNSYNIRHPPDTLNIFLSSLKHVGHMSHNAVSPLQPAASLFPCTTCQKAEGESQQAMTLSPGIWVMRVRVQEARPLHPPSGHSPARIWPEDSNNTPGGT